MDLNISQNISGACTFAYFVTNRHVAQRIEMESRFLMSQRAALEGCGIVIYSEHVADDAKTLFVACAEFFLCVKMPKHLSTFIVIQDHQHDDELEKMVNGVLNDVVIRGPQLESFTITSLHGSMATKTVPGLRKFWTTAKMREGMTLNTCFQSFL